MSEQLITEVMEQLQVNEDYFQKRGLIRHQEPDSELVVVQVDHDGRKHELVTHAAEAWRQMRAMALADGCELQMVSAFRSIARQAEIVLAKQQRGLAADEIFSVSAPPGYSEHHTGRAIDISTPGYAALEEEFEESDAFQWLCNNAAKFGFKMTYGRENPYGYLYEPWHWYYEGNNPIED